MILFFDRCVVSEEVKKKIVKSVVSVLLDFVEIEFQEKVQLSVLFGVDFGIVYFVTIFVRRVKLQYQEEDEVGFIMNVEYKDKGEIFGFVDVRFDFYVLNES